MHHVILCSVLYLWEVVQDRKILTVVAPSELRLVSLHQHMLPLARYYKISE